MLQPFYHKSIDMHGGELYILQARKASSDAPCGCPVFVFLSYKCKTNRTGHPQGASLLASPARMEIREKKAVEGIALFRCNFSGIPYVSIQEEDMAMVLRLPS